MHFQKAMFSKVLHIQICVMYDNNRKFIKFLHTVQMFYVCSTTVIAHTYTPGKWGHYAPLRY